MTYTPRKSQVETKIDIAQKQLEENMLAMGIHTVYQGEKIVNGRPTGEPAIVCVVEDKGTKAFASIPPYIEVNGQRIPTDVVQEQRPRDLRLPLDQVNTVAVTTHQQCHNCPIPGGVQIAPQGKNWVGTLSCALKAGGKYAALTNAHVSDLRGKGNKCCQPVSSSGWIGVFSKVVGIRFDGQANYIDAAIIDTLRTDGPFAPQTHTVHPEQLDVGRIKPSPVKASVGMEVVKSGRTTGVTRGKVVGINATSHVGYSEGTAKFERQVVIQSTSGNFSAGGDSGSLVMSADLRPTALLFAGGGGQTICNPIEFVLDWADAEFF